MDPIVILGAGLAGYTLVREFRKLDSQTPLVLITGDDGRNYSKPMLSTGFAKGKDADGLAMQSPEGMAEQFNARIVTAATVASIDRLAKELVLDNGDREPYGRLVLALGAEPVVAPLKGDALDKVLSVNDLQDYDRFRKALPAGGRVAVLGAGLIGCEFANDLRAGDYSVDVIAPSETVMSGLLPENAGRAVQNALDELGVAFHLGHTVTDVNRTDTGVQLTLDNDAHIQADIVLSAIGLRPRTVLAEQAQLHINNGICVDHTLATNDPNIFALGDCAEVNGRVDLYVMPLMTCARALAKTLAGELTAVVYGAMPVIVKTPAYPVVAAPVIENGGQWTTEVEDGGLRMLNYSGDRLLGYVLTGSVVKERMQLNKRLSPVMSAVPSNS